MVGYLLAIMLLQIVSDSPLKMYSNVVQPNCTFGQPHTYCVEWKITCADHYFELSVFSEFDRHNVISSSATCITCVYSIILLVFIVYYVMVLMVVILSFLDVLLTRITSLMSKTNK